MENKISENKYSFYKMAFALIFPMALQNLIVVGINSIDVLMLGSVSETVLSAASLAGQVQFIMTLIFFGLTSGAAVLTAQYWGKGDKATIEKIMGICMRFSLSVAIFFTAAVLLFPAQIMHIFTDEAPVIAEGVKYLRIISLSYIFMSVTMIYLNVMRSVERVLVSTVIYLISLFVNVIIASLFILGAFGCPKLGIQGAAVAALSARAVELISVFIYAKRINKVILFRFKTLFVRDSILFQDFIRYSIPVTINELMWGTGVAMNAVVIGHLGSSVVSANSVAQITRQLATVIAFGIANAAAITIGKTIGENNIEAARIYAKRFVKLSILAGLIGGIVILIVRPVLMTSLSLSDVTQGYLSTMMFIMSYFVVAQAVNTTLVVGIFRGGGDIKFGLYLDVSTMWGGSILIGALAAFVFHWSVPVVYMILMSDEIIKIPLILWRYKSKKWLNNVTRDLL
ncbi:putative MATE family efflux protein [Ruminiclostridium sufflavum DSM 19573]|uniref:Putative MATE family efflux protein n=1 Tax=Ruminiclostridium sufflavum DSM 19573 TaxID=1121337 RepID=A0A318XPP9_9FIRM|nr:MATE family efflux transporter [Ruminiclostridium sufflavum]PYG89864.1 putative MATE family efflux protein [Ruminiclostridium sufflavum DSM 19573]